MLQPSRDLLLYQATQCHAEFVIHAEGVALQGQVFSHRHRTEVRMIAAVSPACHRDVTPAEDARITPHSLVSCRLYEGEMLVVEELLTLHVAALLPSRHMPTAKTN